MAKKLKKFSPNGATRLQTSKGGVHDLPVVVSGVVVGWTLLFLTFGLLIPVGSLGLWVMKDLSSFGRVFLDSSVLAVAKLTFLQAFLSALISGLGGFCIALWAGRCVSERIDRWIQLCFSIPYGIPTIIVAMSWMTWLGRSGWLALLGISVDWNYSLKAVILAHVFLNLPLAALVLYRVRQTVSESQLEAARSLGASSFMQLRWIVWPQMKWAFWSVFAQIIGFCSMSFALVLILGGGPPVQTLETELFQQLRYGMQNISGAVACACWEILLTGVPWILVLYFRSRQEVNRSADRSYEQSNKQSTIQVKFERQLYKNNPNFHKKRNRIHLKWIAILFCSVFFLLPYVAMVWVRDLSVYGSQKEWWIPVLTSLQYSLQIAGCTSILTVFTASAAVLGLLLCQRWPSGIKFGLDRILLVLLGLPSGLSALVLSLGAWIAYGAWVDLFEQSFFAILFFQTVLFFPFAFRLLWPVSQTMPVQQMDSALLMGASWFQAFRVVDWVRWKGPLLSVAAGVAGASLGELGVVSFFYSEHVAPVSLLLSRWMSQYRFEEARILASLLFLLILFLMAISFYGISWLREIQGVFEKQEQEC